MNITVHQVRDLALRIFGLFCSLQLVMHIARTVYLVTLVGDISYPGNPENEMVAGFAGIFFYLLATYLLLFRTSDLMNLIWRNSNTDLGTPSDQGIVSLSFWVQVVGLYFLLLSLAEIASLIWYWLPGAGSDPMYSSDYLTGQTLRSSVMLALAATCIRWPNALICLFRPTLMRSNEVPKP
ncbi:MAG: hypothetical protein IT364_13135 [Candidatus Hydrogenedentes bacterium]|nr:hypothetical protein [Candidatus Hydrogenedentota bacterium]